MPSSLTICITRQAHALNQTTRYKTNQSHTLITIAYCQGTSQQPIQGAGSTTQQTTQGRHALDRLTRPKLQHESSHVIAITRLQNPAIHISACYLAILCTIFTGRSKSASCMVALLAEMSTGCSTQDLCTTHMHQLQCISLAVLRNHHLCFIGHEQGNKQWLSWTVSRRPSAGIIMD